MADELPAKPERKARQLKVSGKPIDEFTMRRALEAGRKVGLL